jgi:hypothetical protein
VPEDACPRRRQPREGGAIGREDLEPTLIARRRLVAARSEEHLRASRAAGEDLGGRALQQCRARRRYINDDRNHRCESDLRDDRLV